MATSSKDSGKFGAKCQPIKLGRYFNWPRGAAKEEWWQKLADRIGKYPAGRPDQVGNDISTCN